MAISDTLIVKDEWPLKRKLVWFTLYFAMFIWAGLIILPQRL